jgi:hypothetical protein
MIIDRKTVGTWKKERIDHWVTPYELHNDLLRRYQWFREKIVLIGYSFIFLHFLILYSYLEILILA